MADDDREQDAPPLAGRSLERPSLGIGRRRRPKAVRGAPAPDTAPDTEQVVPVDDAPTVTPARAATPIFAAQPAAPLFADELVSAPTVITQDQSTHPTEAIQCGSLTATRRAPLITAKAAAVITGLLIGAVMVVLTAGSLQLCETVRGTSSCGNSGFLLLVAILMAMILLGTALLRAFRVTDPGSTSFLAVGLLAVLTLLFLVDVLANWWMILVIPVLSALTFALSHYVTTAIVEPADHATKPTTPTDPPETL